MIFKFFFKVTKERDVTFGLVTLYLLIFHLLIYIFFSKKHALSAPAGSLRKHPNGLLFFTGLKHRKQIRSSNYQRGLKFLKITPKVS